MKHLLTATLAALLVASLAAPGAAGYDSPAVVGEAVKSRTAQLSPAPVFVPVDEGFQWADAAIGAAGAFGLATIGAAGFALRPRRRLGAAH